MIKFKENLNTFFILLVAFIMYKVVENHRFFLQQLGVLLRILAPFIWAFGIAYILNPIMNAIEKSHYRVNRFLAIGVIYIGFLGLMTFLITKVSPSIASNINEILEKLPKYVNDFEVWINTIFERLSFRDDLGINEFISKNLESYINKALEFLNLTLSGAINSIIGLTSGVAKFLVALIISVYMLADKEKFKAGLKKNIRAFAGDPMAERIFDYGREVNDIFSNFFLGKLVDSIIIGIMCYIGMSLMNVRFAMLLSIIVGIFNMIPYFGPFIGAVPAIVITLFIDPVQALWVSLFILALQQFDGLILGPKILGDKVGVSPFYIILGIFIGGGFFGPVGMLMGVPVMKSFFVLWEKVLSRKLIKNKLSE